MDLQLDDRPILHVKINEVRLICLQGLLKLSPTCRSLHVQYICVSVNTCEHACVCVCTLYECVSVGFCLLVWSESMCLQAVTCSNNHITIKPRRPLNFQPHSVSREKPSGERSTARCLDVTVVTGKKACTHVLLNK